MGTSETAAASAKDLRQLTISELMKIDGIAEKTAEALVELDIHSYADLVEYVSQHSAQEISAALKEHGVNRPPALIDQEAWAKQAERFSRLEDTRQLTISKLTKIDGMAKKPAEATVEFDIHSHADLIEYLNQRIAQEVLAALKAHDLNRPPEFINQERSTGQADLFSQLEDAPSTSSEEETEPTKHSEEAVPSAESREHDALFTVSFEVATDGDHGPVLRTTVCDGADGGQEKVFRGNGTTPWVNWMLERANLTLAVEHVPAQAEVTSEPPPTETEATTPPVPAGQYDAQLEIDDVKLSVIEPTPEYLGKRLKAEIGFQLSGADAETLTSQGSPFRIEGYTVDSESGVSKLVAFSHSQLEPQVFKYRSQLRFDMPDVGHYEVHSRVLLHPPIEMVAYHRGPTMRVVP
jgi:hypothetical protein